MKKVFRLVSVQKVLPGKREKIEFQFFQINLFAQKKEIKKTGLNQCITNVIIKNK